MRFFVRRAAFYAFTAWAAITINFFLPRMLKGDPITAYLARNQGKISPDAIDSLRTLFGMDNPKPIWQQYVDYWVLLFHGDLGRSLSKGLAPVSEVIADALPWTLGLVGVATVLSFLVGTSIGTFIGWRRGTRAEIMVPIATFFSTVPYFWLGLIVIALFSTTLRWFPASHAFSKGAVPNLSFEFIGDVIYHAALPALTIVITSLGGWILGMRNTMISTLGDDYVTFAEANGLKPRTIALKYAARNAILPNLTGFGLALGGVVGGSILVERVFGYPGIGYLLFNAVTNQDYPLMQALFLMITVSVLVANFLVDIIYGVLDPRTRR